MTRPVNDLRPWIGRCGRILLLCLLGLGAGQPGVAQETDTLTNFRIICGLPSGNADGADVFTIELAAPQTADAATLATYFQIGGPREDAAFRVVHYRNMRFGFGEDILSVAERLTPENVFFEIRAEGAFGNGTLNILGPYLRESGTPYLGRWAWIDLSVVPAWGSALRTLYSREPGTGSVQELTASFTCGDPQIVEVGGNG
jgi:hypothetical protein